MHEWCKVGAKLNREGTMKVGRMSLSLSDRLYKRLQEEKKQRPHLRGNAIIVEALAAQMDTDDNGLTRKKLHGGAVRAFLGGIQTRRGLRASILAPSTRDVFNLKRRFAPFRA
jgi:hypothetical protein